MTTDETRDELARMDGWTLTPMGVRSQIVHPDPTATYTYTASVPCGPCRWLKDGVIHKDHPHPPTLDGANAAVPEGYEWERTSGKWLAWEHEESFGRPINVPDTGNPMGDLYALALACRRAMEEKR